MAELLNEREKPVPASQQALQDEAFTRAYTPEMLVRWSNRAANLDDSLPIASVGKAASDLCNFGQDLNQSDCQKAFSIYEDVIRNLPATAAQVAEIQAQRELTQQKWNAHEKIEEPEKLEYWKKLDQMAGASNMRFLYGVTLNNYGYKFNDEAAKAKGLQMLDEANQIEPGVNELTGALLQAKRGEAVDYRKAASEGAVDRAVSHLPKIQSEDSSWTVGFGHWLQSSIGVEDEVTHARAISIARVSSDLQPAAAQAPISTKEYLDKAAAKLDPESAAILQSEFKKTLHN